MTKTVTLNRTVASLLTVAVRDGETLAQAASRALADPAKAPWIPAYEAIDMTTGSGSRQLSYQSLSVNDNTIAPYDPDAPMDLDAAQAALDVWGLNVVPRTELLMLPFPVHCYGDDTGKNAKKHEAVRTEWRNRVSQYPGAYVIYDPSADAEGWMLVGDDLAAIVKESVTHHEEIRL